MKHAEPLERPYLKGVGRQIPRQRLTSSQMSLVYKADLQAALRHAAKGPASGYFSKKAALIEQAHGEFRKLAARTEGHEYEMGYFPGRSYIYPGLPMDFALDTDPAILGTMEILADCRLVAMAGACCAGHPSVFMGNPHLEESREDPGYAARHSGEHGYEQGIYSMNYNPYAILLVHQGQASVFLVKLLNSVHVNAALRGRGEVSVKCSCEASDFKFERQPLVRVEIQGLPSLRFELTPLDHGEFVQLYQRALAGFWKGVLGAFGLVPGEGAAPEPEKFTEKENLDWKHEYGYYSGRRRNGHCFEDAQNGGMRLPDYHYFMGKRASIAPNEDNE